MKANYLSSTLSRRGSILLGASLGAMALSAPAAAQEVETVPDQELSTETRDTVVVTGSRIARRDYQATSPIVTVEEDLFENTSTTSIEAQLNKLPQFTSTLDTPYDAGDIQPTSTETPGTASVALRGLGANRTLTLVDGRRATPANARGVFDINALPAAAIERVEIITGGASATYGADAVAGVVNFILKDDFQGLDFDTQYSTTEAGDGDEFNVSVLTGANFDDGRGNVMFGMEYYDRKAAYRRNRDAFIDSWSSPDVGGVQFFPPFPLYGIGGAGDGFPTNAALATVFPEAAPGSILNVVGDIAFFPTGSNPANAEAFSGIGLFAGVNTGGAYKFPGEIDGVEYFTQSNGVIGMNFVDELAALPLDRWNFFGSSEYELTDNITFYTQGYFARSSARTIQQASPAGNNWGTVVPYGDDLYEGNPDLGIPSSLNDDGTTTHADYLAGGLYGLDCDPMGGCTNSEVFPVPDELALLLDSRTAIPDGTGPSLANSPYRLGTYLDYLGNRVSETDNFTFQALAGFQGTLPSLGWDWEVYGSHGQTRVNSLITGVASLQRHRAVMTAPNYGRNFSLRGNQLLQGFGGATGTCTSGLNPYTTGTITDDCKEAIAADLRNSSDITQSIVEGTVTGGLVDLPAGELQFAAGADYRRLKFEFSNDTLTTQGRSFLDQAIGIYPSGNSEGEIETVEGYAEVLVPVLSDMPMVQQFNLELGARYSDYNTTGGDWTYKFLADWEVTDFMRLRGGYNRATRSPNIAELFQAPQQTFGVAAAGDPCATGNTSSYSANPATNSDAAQVEALCRSLIGTTAGATGFYANPQNQSGGAAFVFTNSVGNDSLTPETADTWTVGAVFSSPSENPWLSGARLSVDYYNIKVKDAIGVQTADTVQRQCFDPIFNASYDPNAEFCQAITRDPVLGTITLIQTTYTNDVRFKTAGIDITANWGVDLEDVGMGVPGQFNLNVIVNYLLAMEASTLDVLPVVDYVGTLGPAGEGGINPGAAYKWRSFTSASYSNGPVTVGVQWQHMPPTDSINASVDPDTAFTGAPSHNIVNLNGSYAITPDVVLRAGIDNLLDNDPPLTEVNTAAGPGQLSGGTVGVAQTGIYDFLGRRYYVGLKVQF